MDRMKGPGHSPPIPQPSPKRTAPANSFSDIFPWGFYTLSPQRGFLLNELRITHTR